MATNAIIQPGTRKVKARKTRFGSVTVTAPPPSKAMVQHNVKASTQALERVTGTVGEGRRPASRQEGRAALFARQRQSRCDDPQAQREGRERKSR